MLNQKLRFECNLMINIFTKTDLKLDKLLIFVVYYLFFQKKIIFL
jgi:hypothetical protein